MHRPIFLSIEFNQTIKLAAAGRGKEPKEVSSRTVSLWENLKPKTSAGEKNYIMSVANFASEDEMLKASMDETAILGASRAALEGILSRRASLDKRILIPTYRQTTKTNKKVKPECAYEGGINGTKNDGGSHQLFHTKLHDALTRIYETKSYTSILGATFAAIEGAASRRMSRAVPPAGIEGQTSARLTLLSQEAPRSTKSSFDNDELQKTLNRKVDDLLARGKWKPSNCPSRYAKLFPMLPRTREKEGDDTIKLNVSFPCHLRKDNYRERFLFLRSD